MDYTVEVLGPGYYDAEGEYAGSNTNPAHLTEVRWLSVGVSGSRPDISIMIFMISSCRSVFPTTDGNFWHMV